MAFALVGYGGCDHFRRDRPRHSRSDREVLMNEVAIALTGFVVGATLVFALMIFLSGRL